MRSNRTAYRPVCSLRALAMASMAAGTLMAANAGNAAAQSPLGPGQFGGGTGAMSCTDAACSGTGRWTYRGDGYSVEVDMKGNTPNGGGYRARLTTRDPQNGVWTTYEEVVWNGEVISRNSWPAGQGPQQGGGYGGPWRGGQRYGQPYGPAYGQGYGSAPYGNSSRPWSSFSSPLWSHSPPWSSAGSPWSSYPGPGWQGMPGGRMPFSGWPGGSPMGAGGLPPGW